jgi:hypothetical protein
MNLKEAKKRNKLPQFAKEIKDPHPQGKERFDALLGAMPADRLHSWSRFRST